jgi:hypothetical protein
MVFSTRSRTGNGEKRWDAVEAGLDPDRGREDAAVVTEVEAVVIVIAGPSRCLYLFEILDTDRGQRPTSVSRAAPLPTFQQKKDIIACV